MEAMGLRSRIRRKYLHYGRAWNEGDRATRNMLQRGFRADAPNQKWVTDITPYRIGEAWFYLSAIKDLCQKEIVAFPMSHRNDTELVLETCAKVFEKEKVVTGLIVHRDQGAQITMSRRGNCHDNASMESFFSHFKTEDLYPYGIRSMEGAQRRMEEYIHFYTNNRPQRKLNKLSPVKYRQQLVG